MKKNKKLFAVLAALAMGMSLSLTGCSSESSGGGSSGVSGKPGAASLLEFTEGTVIRNKVVNLDSDAVLYEYLKFTSPTAGEYSLYSYDEETGFTKETTVDSISVPASFIYNAEDGSFKTLATQNIFSFFLSNSSFNNSSSIILPSFMCDFIIF